MSHVQGASQILGQAEKDFGQGQPKTGPASEMDRDAFLKLLITQLEHQDPTEPMKDEDFVAQLAQFTSVEKMTQIADGVDQLNQGANQNHMLDAVSFMGKEVTAEGSSLSKDASGVSSMTYTLDSAVQNVRFNVFDPSGNIIRTIEAGAVQSGTHSFTWDGKDYQGNDMPAGQYPVGISAVDANGQPIQVDSQVSGRVTGIRNADGQTLLSLADGREVDLLSISEVIEPDNSTSE